MIVLYNGIEEIKLEVNDESYSYESIMGELSLTLCFDHPGYLEIPVGSWCDFYGKRYYLNKDSNFKKNGERNFKYTLILETSKFNATLWKVRNTVDNRIKFPYTAKPEEHLRTLIENLNRRSTGWKVGNCIEGTEKLINYSHTYILDGLNQLAALYETEWQITEETVNGKQIKTVHLKKVEYNKDNPLKLSYGKGHGFKTGVGRESGDIPPEIILVETTDQNIDYSKYGAKELLMPKSQTLEYEGHLYKTDAEGSCVMRADKELTTSKEDSLDCTEIYPSRVGIISSVFEVNADNNFYDFVDKDIPESLNFEDCQIAGESMTVIFQTGMLSGKEFEVKYIHKAKDKKEARRFEIVPQEIDGITMPEHEAWRPGVGDTYIVFGIQLPDSYICDNTTKTGASWDVFKEAAKYLYEHEDKKFTFTGTLDGIWAKKRWLQIGGKIILGGYVNFYDTQFHPEGSLIRMIGIKRYVNNPYSPEIELSNNPVGSSISSELNKIETNEVTVESKHKDALQFTKRRFRDAKETMDMLEDSLLNFSGAINPIAVQAMQLLVGDESLQFRFVNSKTNPVQTSHNIAYNANTRILNAPNGILQHMTLGISTLSSSHKAGEYKFWDMNNYDSPTLIELEKKYYLYAKCSKDNQSGEFLLNEKAIKMEGIDGYYHFLVGVLNSEYDGGRSFAELYGFTEILPGRVTTERIVSSDGLNFMDFTNNAFRVGNEQHYFDWNTRSDGKFKLKGAIVQSESGDENPVGCFRGVYNSSYTYYWGDEVAFTTSNVTSKYRYVSKTSTSGKEPTDVIYWLIVVEGVKGENGSNGDYFEYLFAMNGSITTSPSIDKEERNPLGWTTEMPVIGESQYLWLSVAKISGTSNELLQNWSSPVRQTPYDGVDGEAGKAPACVFRGEYNLKTIYYGTPIRVDIVKYNSHYYIARTDAGDENGFVGKSPTDENYWNNFGAEFESVATQLLLAERANIANFIFANSRLESQFETGGISNIILDAFRGVAQFVAGDVFFGEDYAKIGLFKVERVFKEVSGVKTKVSDDFIGYDADGSKRIRLTNGDIPALSELTDMGELSFEVPEDQGFDISYDKYGNVEVETEGYRTTIDDPWGSGDLYENNWFIFRIAFEVSEPGTIISFSAMYGVEASTPGMTCECNVTVRTESGTVVATLKPVVTDTTTLPVGKYFAAFDVTVKSTDDWQGKMYLNIGAVIRQIRLKQVCIGRNGLIASYNGNYLRFNSDDGFEVKVSNVGLRLNSSGIYRYNGNSWISF